MHAPPDLGRGEARRVTLVGALASLALAGVQATAGLLGHSQALVADAIHSLSDLATDVAVWVGLTLSAAPPDDDHPWGHGKIETLTSLLVGAALGVVAFGLGADALARLRDATFTTPTVWPLLAAALAVVTKEALYRWTVAVGRRVRSRALIANAWHHRSDALSSIAATIGVAAAIAGLPWMDAVAAIVVSLLIVRVAGHLTWAALRDLVERQADDETTERVRAVLEADPGVIDVHRLRLRTVGGVVVGDVHITIDGDQTVRDGHDIAHRLEQRAVEAVPALADLVIHVDPAPAGVANRGDVQ